MLSCAVFPLKFSNKEFLLSINSLLKSEFNFQTIVQEENIDLEKYFSRERNQYYSTKILAEYLEKFQLSFDKILILTDSDLYIPILTFLFGEAQLDGKGAIVSSHRLHQEFYGLPSDKLILNERLSKEIFHEFGHTFGLRHCKSWECVMHASLNIDEIDIKGVKFCRSCREFVDKKL